jgi:hypothetical protein
MSDNLKDRGPADRARINVHESWELSYWCKALGCSEPQLKEAVKSVGVSSAAVRQHLEKRNRAG